MLVEKAIKFDALKIKQPVGDFFIGVMGSRDLVQIAFADVRRIERELDNFMGIQRKLDPKRVKAISQYVNNIDASFPTSIILAVKSENARWDEGEKKLSLFANENESLRDIARIIDGQHRIEGLKEIVNNDFMLNVSIFIGADLATQANIFATVNLAQTKVNRSLVYDLYDLEKIRSPQKAAHHIAVALDQYEMSPFFNRIKRLGLATEGREKEPLTQAAVVESLLMYISPNPDADRQNFFKKVAPSFFEQADEKKFILRKMFLRDQDTDITQLIIAYFNAVKQKWPQAWNDLDRQGNVLPKTNGFKALMRFFRPSYLSIVGNDIGSLVHQSQFQEIFNKVTLQDSDFGIDKFPPGTSGESKLFQYLMDDVFPNNSVQSNFL